MNTHSSCLISLSLLLVLQLSSFVSAEAIRPGDTACLLIGVANVGNANLFAVLQSPYKDVQDMQNKLQESGYGNIVSYTDQKTVNHISLQRSVSGARVRIDRLFMLAELEKLSRQATNAGKKILVFYFTGHGIRINGKSYIVLEGADINKPDETMISLTEIYAILQHSMAQKIVLFDCCQNELQNNIPQDKWIQFTSKGFAKGMKEEIPQGFVVMTSCAEGQTSVERGADGSVFTREVTNSSILKEFKSIQANVLQNGLGQVPQLVINSRENSVVSGNTVSQEEMETNKRRLAEEKRRNDLLEQQNRLLVQQNVTLEQQHTQQNRTYAYQQPNYTTKSYSPPRQIPVKVNVGSRGGSVNIGGFRFGW